MNLFLRITLIIFLVLFAGICGLLGYLKFALPNVGAAPDITIESTPVRLERGKYLAHSVAACMDCHSTRDWNTFAGPIIPGTLGIGGEVFDQTMGFPGSFISKNITPFALAKWTDGDIYRAITSGVNKDGVAMFPVMPYSNYRSMDKEDIYSIIAYIKSIPAIQSKVMASKPDFPMNFIINTIPQKADHHPIPAKSDKVLYGKYLFTMASCNDCHTKSEKGKPIEGMELAGGFEFGPLATGGTVRSANITPDKQNGIGNWTEQQFVSRFKTYADSSYKLMPVEDGNFTTIMPWMMYKDMSEGDLAAIFAYLQTVKPVNNEVLKFTKSSATASL